MNADLMFKCSDGYELVYNLWLPEEGRQVRYFLQIIHGMVEHSARYKRYAKELNEHGIAVFAADLRGHGKSTSPEDRGWFGESDGWARVAKDNFELANYITTKYGARQTFLLGCSMGSLFARTVMVDHPDFYSGVLILGTTASQGIVGAAGRLVAKRQIKKNGAKAKGHLLSKLTFGPYAKSVAEARTEFDWLSTDPEEVDKYINDPDCGFVCTNRFYLDLLDGVAYANSPRNAASLPKDLPLIIISGEDDPVGGMGRGVRKVYNLYKKAGINDVTLKILKGARHEILNDFTRDDVHKMTIDWMDAHASEI